jgi:hypothetical protein
MKPAVQKTNGEKSKKSKLQLKYEKLLEQINSQQLYNQNLNAGLNKAQIKATTELVPLIKQQHVLQRDLLLVLNEFAEKIGLGKYNREWFDSYMADEAIALLDIFGYQDKELSTLLEKYGDTTIKDMIADEETQAMAQSFSKVFGFDIDIEEMLNMGHNAYFSKHQNEFIKNMADAREQNANETSQTINEEPGKGKTNKSAKQQKSVEENKTLAKEARNVYMRLIKKFHPDLESDEALQAKKNEIVKEVTKAYQENDFFTLLQLQIKYLDDNEAEAEALAEDMLKRYNKILQKQLNELKQRILEQYHISGDLIEDYIDKNGNFSPQKFASRKRNLEKENTAIKNHIQASQKKPKTWFKDYIKLIKDIKQQQMMADMFANMFNTGY